MHITTYHDLFFVPVPSWPLAYHQADPHSYAHQTQTHSDTSIHDPSTHSTDDSSASTSAAGMPETDSPISTLTADSRVAVKPSATASVSGASAATAAGRAVSGSESAAAAEKRAARELLMQHDAEIERLNAQRAREREIREREAAAAAALRSPLGKKWKVRAHSIK